jgi:DNA-binding transcriptional LysR family regulator
MTAAARQLRVSQPTLSVAVRELEARLKTSLFLRGTRGVVPTASGRALVRAAEDIFGVLRQVDDELHGIETAPAGRFVVGCYHSLGALFLPGLMRSLQARAPAVELSFWEGTGPQIQEAVLDRAVHFGVDAGLAPPLHPELVVVSLFRDVMGVVRGRRRGAPGPLFHVPRIPSSERVLAALRARGKLPDRLVPCGDLELVKSLVLDGAGIGVLPWRVAAHGTRRDALRLVDSSWPFEVDVGAFFYRADLHRTVGAMCVRDAIVSRGRELDAVALPAAG